MSASLVVLAAAAAALVGLASSALIGGALALGRARLAGLVPAARARLLLVAAVLPAITALAALLAALSPSLGWIADHCLPVGDPHGHPHLCAAHHAGWPTLPLLALAGLLGARLALGWGRIAAAAWRARRVGCALERDAVTVGGLRVLPLDAAQAFLLGALRPVLFVTRGLLAAELAPHLDAVLAHERAHLRRRDGLRRLVAALALPFHLPGLAGGLGRALGQVHEMAADDDAAAQLGSRARAAAAIVAVARAARPAPAGALAFVGSQVERRVLRLLEARAGAAGPGPRALALGVAAALGAILSSADVVHHGLETALGLLGG